MQEYEVVRLGFYIYLWTWSHRVLAALIYIFLVPSGTYHTFHLSSRANLALENNYTGGLLCFFEKKRQVLVKIEPDLVSQSRSSSCCSDMHISEYLIRSAITLIHANYNILDTWIASALESSCNKPHALGHQAEGPMVKGQAAIVEEGGMWMVLEKFLCI